MKPKQAVCVLVGVFFLPMLPAQMVATDTQCGVTKGCFSDCGMASSCGFLVTWQQNGNDVTYTMASKLTLSLNADSSENDDSYVVVGLSTDQSMGQDSVFGCTKRSNSVAVYVGYNPNGHGGGNQPFTDADIELLSYSTDNGVLKCTVKRPVTANGNRYAADVDHYYFLARGKPAVANGISRHASDARFISQGMLNSTSLVHDGGSVVTEPPPPASGAITKNPQCGTTLGCFSDSDLTFEITWEVKGQKAEYVIRSVGSSGSDPYYFAIGFSSDSDMGGELVIGAAGDESLSKAAAFNAENNGKSSSVKDQLHGTELMSSSFDSGVYTFTLHQAINPADWVDISQKWTLLFARGQANFANDNTVGSIKKHPSASHRFLSGQAVSVNDKIDVGSKAKDQDLVKAHGCLMIVAWVFFASVGVLMPRFYKPAWKDQMCSKDVWFQIHRTCMILAFCATAAGFIIIFVEVEDWSDLEPDDEYLESHPILGCIVMGLTLLNPIMAFFRPHPGTSKRPFFNWGHWFVGTAAHIIGVVNIFFGLELFEFEEDYLIYILAGFVGWHIFMELLLLLITCCCRDTSRQEMYELGEAPKGRNRSQESQKALTIKKGLLVLHFLVVTAITAVLVALLADADEE